MASDFYEHEVTFSTRHAAGFRVVTRWRLGWRVQRSTADGSVVVGSDKVWLDEPDHPRNKTGVHDSLDAALDAAWQAHQGRLSEIEAGTM